MYRKLPHRAHEDCGLKPLPVFHETPLGTLPKDILLLTTSGRTSQEETIARRPMTPPQAQKGPRVNEQITEKQVRLIDAEGNNRDVVSIEEALDLAAEAGLDLVEVSPNASPPVCKILDYGKFKYEAQKKASLARKKQKTIDVKEIKMRPGIEKHDYDVKMRSIEKFLNSGDKVKVTLRFRGREMAHQELGMEVLQRVQADFEDKVKIEQHPKLEGRQMIMIIAPK